MVEPASKKVELDEEPGAVTHLGNFRVERTLAEDTRSKYSAVLGSFVGLEGQAILRMEARHISDGVVQQLVDTNCVLEEELANDIYRKCFGYIPAGVPTINVDIIHPCTDKHIKKYTQADHVWLAETAEAYKSIVEPFISSLPDKSISWVYNILEKKAEADRLLFEDSCPRKGFMLHPDMKWDRQDLKNLYCIALCMDRAIRSLRDLKLEHIELLQNIRDKGTQAIQERFGVSRESLRIFVHYHPSYYHFHVHFTRLGIGGGGELAGRAHLLDDIIENIQTFPDYYQKRTLFFEMNKNHALVDKLAK
mmetsp:Transcript_13046/g.47640  ORF Transcript_13046/g.47640 Transcript_13046/m.47640 type:complete len:307 (-) Transcript_13046:221-1141(-)